MCDTDYHLGMFLSILHNYAAQDEYTIIPELDAEKGYVNRPFNPKTSNMPVLMIN